MSLTHDVNRLEPESGSIRMVHHPPGLHNSSVQRHSKSPVLSTLNHLPEGHTESWVGLNDVHWGVNVVGSTHV